LRAFETKIRCQAGSAVVDFALIVPLLLAVVLAVAQLVLAWHVRTLLTSAAQVGSQSAAASGADLRVVEEAVGQKLANSLAQDLVNAIEVEYVNQGMIGLARVSVQGRLPMLGLLGPNQLYVQSYSVIEHW
jgi:Flp pilus assembly protein TadG